MADRAFLMADPLVAAIAVGIITAMIIANGIRNTKPDCHNASTTPPNGGECYHTDCRWHCDNEPICCSNGEITNDH